MQWVQTLHTFMDGEDLLAQLLPSPPFLLKKMRLKEIRKKNRFTQNEIAKIVGCTSGAYSKYELGDRKPPLTVLCKLADVYGVSLDYLVERNTGSSGVLTKDERELLEKYRSCEQSSKDIFFSVLDALKEKEKRSAE